VKHIAFAMLLAAFLGYSAYHWPGRVSHSFYQSVDGLWVHGPDYDPHNVTAHCRDGTLSHSRHQWGTCNYHGGEEHWN
jgi:Protein of unknown function (DUF3761)